MGYFPVHKDLYAHLVTDFSQRFETLFGMGYFPVHKDLYAHLVTDVSQRFETLFGMGFLGYALMLTFTLIGIVLSSD
jgi:hypothetical protein